MRSTTKGRQPPTVTIDGVARVFLRSLDSASIAQARGGGMLIQMGEVEKLDKACCERTQATSHGLLKLSQGSCIIDKATLEGGLRQAGAALGGDLSQEEGWAVSERLQVEPASHGAWPPSGEHDVGHKAPAMAPEVGGGNSCHGARLATGSLEYQEPGARKLLRHRAPSGSGEEVVMGVHAEATLYGLSVEAAQAILAARAEGADDASEVPTVAGATVLGRRCRLGCQGEQGWHARARGRTGARCSRLRSVHLRGQRGVAEARPCVEGPETEGKAGQVGRSRGRVVLLRRIGPGSCWDLRGPGEGAGSQESGGRKTHTRRRSTGCCRRSGAEASPGSWRDGLRLRHGLPQCKA